MMSQEREHTNIRTPQPALQRGEAAPARETGATLEGAAQAAETAQAHQALSAAAVVALQRTIGNAAVNRLLQQPSGPGDTLAAQARRALDRPRSPLLKAGSASPASAPPSTQDAAVQRQAAPAVAPGPDDLGQRIRAAGNRGQPLEAGVQRPLEAGLGADLSGVRVHTDGEADRLAQAVQAVAFTTGSNIFFRAGTYNPGTPQGQHLLAHEAAHTVQQARGPVAGTPWPGGVSVSEPGDRFERAADAAAHQVMAPAAPPAQRTAATPVQRTARAGAALLGKPLRATREDAPHPQPASTRPDNGPLTRERLLPLPRTIGNRAVASMLGGPRPPARPSGAAPIVQRLPMVWNQSQNKREDAAGWTDDELTAWQNWYMDETPETQEKFLTDNNAVLQMIAKRGRAESEFQQSRQPMTRPPDQQEIREAEGLLLGLVTEDSSGWVFSNVDPSKAVNELYKAIQDPGAMNQAGFPICGADTYLRMYAIYHPLEYVRFAIALLRTGRGRLGRQVVTAPKEIQARKEFSDEVHISEWIMTASLRSQTNRFFSSITEASDYAFGGKLLAGVSGCTTVGEMKGWFHDAGVPDKAIQSDMWVFGSSDETTIKEINQLFTQGRAVALAIHGDIVGNPIDHEIASDPLGGHFVTLASTFVLTSNNYIADAYTWGGRKRMCFTRGQIGRAITGYVAVDMSQFTPQTIG